jgi:hypothetical protein
LYPNFTTLSETLVSASVLTRNLLDHSKRGPHTPSISLEFYVQTSLRGGEGGREGTSSTTIYAYLNELHIHSINIIYFYKPIFDFHLKVEEKV